MKYDCREWHRNIFCKYEEKLNEAHRDLGDYLREALSMAALGPKRVNHIFLNENSKLEDVANTKSKFTWKVNSSKWK